MIGINVAQLLKLPPGTVRTLDFDDPLPEITADIGLVEPVTGKAQLTRTSRGILAAVQYATRVQLECGRCLEPAQVDIAGDTADEFMPSVDVSTGVPLPEQADSAELVIDDHHILDLTEVIRQDLLTRVPLQPLCSEDCPGMCAQCGADLRIRACSGERGEATQSPFAGLSRLLNDRDSGLPQ
jgi:uncharacterized protein